MEALNNKILVELLPDSEQPKKTIFSPNEDMIKIGIALSTGYKVENVVEKDRLHVYVNSLHVVEGNLAFCSERDVIFRNNYPQPGKIHIDSQIDIPMSSFMKANVVRSSSEDILDQETIFYKKGQSHVLPNNTEIISETQVYYKK